MRKRTSGGGWQAIAYSLRLAWKVGPIRFYRAMRSKNACKTCAFGMGGQLGGMTNEARHFPEVCKKSMQAMAADMQGRVEPRFFQRYSLAELRSFSSREMESCGRLVAPVVCGPGESHFREIGWEEAFDEIASALKGTTPERSFFYASGRSSSEAGFLLHLLGRAYGTNHVNNCSYYCHQASGVGLRDSIGTPTATIDLDDLELCDLVFLIGANPASNHPRLMATLDRVRRRGGGVIVVNPVRELGLGSFRVPSNLRSMMRGSEIASVYVQPTIGGDIALLTGIAKAITTIGGVDQEFVSAATEGFDDFIRYVDGVSWAEIEAGSGVSREAIENLAHLYIKSERTIFAWTMGITHHLHGTENVQWIVNLALLRGMVGKKGAGLLPIRGHSNVQGMGSVGVTPAMSRAAAQRLESIGLKAPGFTGYDTMAAMEAADRGEMDFALALGGNLYGANPDSNFASSALSKVKSVVYLSTSLNTGHAHGVGQRTIILPVRARDEEAQSTTQESMFSFVRLSEGGPARHQGPLSEVEILAEIGRRIGAGRVDWEKLKDHDEVRRLIGRLVPGLEPIAKIGETKQEFTIPGRVLHTPAFPTPSGKAAFRPWAMPDLGTLGDRELRLMTVRSEGQFNTVVYDTEDIYRGQERRDVILVSPSDMTRLGLAEDQRVAVRSEAGEMRGILVRAFDIARGCALMYYPEANVLIGRQVDARSKTPAFKSTIIMVTPDGGSVVSKEELKVASASSRDRMKAC